MQGGNYVRVYFDTTILLSLVKEVGSQKSKLEIAADKPRWPHWVCVSVCTWMCLLVLCVKDRVNRSAKPCEQKSFSTEQSLQHTRWSKWHEKIFQIIMMSTELNKSLWLYLIEWGVWKIVLVKHVGGVVWTQQPASHTLFIGQFLSKVKLCFFSKWSVLWSA